MNRCPRGVRFLRWLVPLLNHLHAVPRIVFGILGNSLLDIYIAPHAMRGIKAYPRLTANPLWFGAVLGTPLAILVCVSPLYLSSRVGHRWAAFVLSFLALFFGFMEWTGFLGMSYE
jgi:ABC-type phosphate transport system permease subunit